MQVHQELQYITDSYCLDGIKYVPLFLVARLVIISITSPFATGNNAPINSSDAPCVSNWIALFAEYLNII